MTSVPLTGGSAINGAGVETAAVRDEVVVPVPGDPGWSGSELVSGPRDGRSSVQVTSNDFEYASRIGGRLQKSSHYFKWSVRVRSGSFSNVLARFPVFLDVVSTCLESS